MPSRTTNSGAHKDMVHPINEAVRALFETSIVHEFKTAKQSGFDRITMEMKSLHASIQEFRPEEYDVNYSNVSPRNKLFAKKVEKQIRQYGFTVCYRTQENEVLQEQFQ